MLREQYSQIYGFLEAKNVESLSYYNEIQRLNGILAELNSELSEAKTANASLSEQCENLSKEMDLQEKLIDELSTQTIELTRNIETAVRQQDESSAAILSHADQSTSAVPGAVEGEEKKEEELRKEIESMRIRMDETQAIYDHELRESAQRHEASMSEVEKQNVKLSKELARLKEHLVEMSESYTREAVQAEEREKQLRTRLSEVSEAIQQHDSHLEASSRDVEVRLEQARQQNEQLRDESERLRDRLRQAEEALGHQVKVAKNLELVLERLQNGE